MKQDLVELISFIPTIETHFRKLESSEGLCVPSREFIYDDTEFCSSVPDYAIPLNQDIYDYLSSLFCDYKLYVVFMLSNNYYKSSACLNEMGAAWVLKNEYITILLPEFEYKEIKGAVNPNKIGMKLDDKEELLKKRLGELKELISKEFSISVPDIRWEKKRNDFIERIKRIS